MLPSDIQTNDTGKVVISTGAQKCTFLFSEGEAVQLTSGQYRDAPKGLVGIHSGESSV